MDMDGNQRAINRVRALAGNPRAMVGSLRAMNGSPRAMGENPSGNVPPLGMEGSPNRLPATGTSLSRVAMEGSVRGLMGMGGNHLQVRAMGGNPRAMAGSVRGLRPREGIPMRAQAMEGSRSRDLAGIGSAGGIDRGLDMGGNPLLAIGGKSLESRGSPRRSEAVESDEEL